MEESSDGKNKVLQLHESRLDFRDSIARKRKKGKNSSGMLCRTSQQPENLKREIESKSLCWEEKNFRFRLFKVQWIFADKIDVLFVLNSATKKLFDFKLFQVSEISINFLWEKF